MISFIDPLTISVKIHHLVTHMVSAIAAVLSAIAALVMACRYCRHHDDHSTDIECSSA
jgi:hypothetical protein